MYREVDTKDIDPQTILGRADLGDGCWDWKGSFYRNGYGKFGRKGYMAHRLSYELTKGNVPKDMCLDHLCSNRACINPGHLEIVTLAENIRRGKSSWGLNSQKTHCINGHEFTNINTYIHPKRGTRNCKKCLRLREKRYRESRLQTLTQQES